MSGLLWKDLTLFWRTARKLLFVFWTLMIGVLLLSSFISEAIYKVVFITPFIMVGLVTTSFFMSYLLTTEKQSNWYRTANDLPVSRQTIVVEKYKVLLIVSIVTALSTWIPSLFILFGLSGEQDIISVTIMVAMLLLQTLMFECISLGIHFIFGMEKARWVTPLAISLILGMVVAVLWWANIPLIKMYEILISYPGVLYALLIAVLLILISIRISIMFFEKAEL